MEYGYMSKKGSIPWNKGKTGIYSAETRQKMSISAKKHPTNFKGKKHTEASKRLISLNNHGGHIKGVPFTAAHIRAMSECRKGKHLANINGGWKGDNVGYRALHDWVVRHKGKAKACGDCGSIGRVHWANKSHEYKRELDDWLEKCNKCHKAYDKGFSKDRYFTKTGQRIIITTMQPLHRAIIDKPQASLTMEEKEQVWQEKQKTTPKSDSSKDSSPES